MDEKSKGRVKKILSFVIAIASFFIVKYAVSEWRQSSANNAAVERVGSEIDKQLVAAQGQATKDRPASEIAKENSIKVMEQKLDAEKSASKRLLDASEMFLGAYHLNTLTRAEYCASLGAPIPSFVSAYTAKHKDLIEIAERTDRAQGRALTTKEIYRQLEPRLRNTFMQDMNDMGSQLNMNHKQVCEALNTYAKEIVDEMDQRKVNPKVTDVLLGKS